MITITGLVKQYQEIMALDHLDLQVDKGIILGLLGPNGAGKTTLVSILNGLTPFQQGTISVFGLSLPRHLKEIRKRCAFIPQSLALYENLTVLENLSFFARIQNIPSDTLKKNLDYAIAVNRLETMLEIKAVHLSGGQKRRLNIGIGLLNNPEILYLDEPTAGIDPELRNDILDSIVQLKNEGKTIVYTSHYMTEIEKICDQVAIIAQGKILRHGNLAELLQNEKNNSAILEISHPDNNLPGLFLGDFGDVEQLDATRLLLHNHTAHQMGKILAVLENNRIQVRNISYGATSLESLFIRLTSGERTDV